MEGTNIFTLCSEMLAVMMMGVSAIAVSAANSYPPAPASTSDASITYIVIAAVASYHQLDDTIADTYAEWGQKLKGPADTDSDASLYSSSSDESEESANETDDADESDMDLSDDNPHGDDDAAGYGVFMYNKSTATPDSTYLGPTITSSSLDFIQTLLDETPANELTDFMSHPVCSSNKKFAAGNVSGRVCSSYTISTSKENSLSYNNSLTKLTPSQSKEADAKGEKNMRKINFKKAVAQKFREYDQKLSQISMFLKHLKKLSHDNQDSPNNREGENKKKRRKDVGEPSSRSSRRNKSPTCRNPEWYTKSGSAGATKRKTTWFDLLLKSDIDKNKNHILGPSIVAIAKKLKAIIQKEELTIIPHPSGMVTNLDFLLKQMSTRTEGSEIRYKEYEFSYADLPRLSLNDVEDMYLFQVQDKLHHLLLEFVKDFNNALFLFIRRVVIQNRVEDIQLGVESYQQTLNLTKPMMFFEGIDQKISFTMFGTHKGVVYLNQHNIKSFMKLSEVNNNKQLKGRGWTDMDVEKSNEMVDKIDKTLKEARGVSTMESMKKKMFVMLVVMMMAVSSVTAADAPAPAPTSDASNTALASVAVASLSALVFAFIY
ncbi:retrotransposon protein, putative, ty1-copia subclass [Tanacetum coccineum]